MTILTPSISWTCDRETELRSQIDLGEGDKVKEGGSKLGSRTLL